MADRLGEVAESFLEELVDFNLALLDVDPSFNAVVTTAIDCTEGGLSLLDA